MRTPVDEDAFMQSLEKSLAEVAENGSLSMCLKQYRKKDDAEPSCRVRIRKNARCRAKKNKCTAIVSRQDAVSFHHRLIKALKPNVVGKKEQKSALALGEAKKELNTPSKVKKHAMKRIRSYKRRKENQIKAKGNKIKAMENKMDTK